jgi:maltose alpha-D-glucosyltransferase/alpha-amylase
MEPMDTDERLATALARWLPAARWCGAKSGPVERLAVAAVLPVATGARLALVDATRGGTTARYVVPVDAAGHDAAAAPAFAAWLVTTALGGGTTDGQGGALAGHPVGPPAAPAAGPVEVTPLGTDASNTSLLVRRGREAFVVKLLRRYRPGVQPEVEIGEFFCRDAPWSGTPRLRGWVEHRPGADPAAAIATVHDHLPGCLSAWDHLLPLVAAGALEPAATDHERRRVIALVEALGRATGEMHRALAGRPDLPAFAPEVPAADARRALVAALVADGRRVLARAATPPPGLPSDVQARLRALASAAPVLLDRLAGADPGDEPVASIRVHGDYHLGQVLVGAHDDAWRVAVIDFEGEPGRSLAERRAKVPAVKDVAGMCRSFDYLLRQAAAAGGPAHDAACLRRLESTYLDAYAAVAAGGCWWPRHPAGLLEAYRLDKALYELAYELDHRPDWVVVPLAALEAAVAA